MKTYEKPEAKLELFVTEEVTSNSSMGVGGLPGGGGGNPFNPFG